MQEVTPAIAFNSQRQEYLVVWSTDRDKCDGIWGQLVSRHGKLLGGAIDISVECPERRYPDVTYDSTHDQYLVVWEQYDESEGYSIQGRRLNGGGKVLDGADLPIRPPDLKAREPSRPAVAYASPSDLFLVVWAETELGSVSNPYKILGARVSDDGTVFNGPFTVSEGTNQRQVPDVAYNFHANRHLVVWQQPSGIYSDIYGQLVHGKDGLYGSAIQIAWYAQPSTAPAVAAMSTSPSLSKFLVVFELEFQTDDRDILGQFVNEDGTVTVDNFFVSAANLIEETDPAIASTESNLQYLVVWTRQSTPDRFIKGRVYYYDGTPEYPVFDFPGTAAGFPAVAGGPVGDFLIAWQDQPGSATSLNIYGQLWGNRVYLPLMQR